jgi:hypothetical protein
MRAISPTGGFDLQERAMRASNRRGRQTATHPLVQTAVFQQRPNHRITTAEVSI